MQTLENAKKFADKMAKKGYPKVFISQRLIQPKKYKYYVETQGRVSKGKKGKVFDYSKKSLK